MKVDVLLGLQWGDEGKGKIVDVLTPQYDVIARFQGGPNAGHSLEFNGIKHVLHTIPSGIFHDKKINLIGNGVVIDPITFKKEVEGIKALGVPVEERLLISRKAHLILPTHRILDAASESAKGKSKIGSTLKGIGPAYMDKTGRNGLRVGDIELPDFKEKYSFLRDKHAQLIELYHYEYDLTELENVFFEGIELLQSLTFVDGEHLINRYIKEGKKILAEGAQGTLLDIDFGSYPYVTSSNTVCAGACIGLGIAPHKIGKVYGIFKAYCTRVGSGPFPTELKDEIGQKLRDIGREYGSTTGRPRRCGWLDLPALKYAIKLNGVTSLIMTKGDVLSNFETLPVATAYEIDGKIIEDIPYDVLNHKLTPVYNERKGWNTSISNIKDYAELPETFRNYIEFVESEVEVPVDIISLGPDREQTIIK